MPKTNVNVRLVGENGNAFVVIGRTTEAMRRAGVDPEIIKQYQNEATSGDYNNLLRVTMEYVDVQ